VQFVKVVYDISILSHGYRAHLARTGIFRVVDRTAHGLESRADVSLEYSSAESWENHYWAHRFLANGGSARSGRLLPHGPLANGLYHLQDYLYGERSSLQDSASAHSVSRLVRRISGAITTRTASLPKSAVQGRDIFHSGYHALPASTSGVKGLRRFLTVYDLIPVLMPHLFAEGVAVGIRKIFMTMLNSIGPDDYVLAISGATKNDLCSYLKIDPSRVFVSPLAASPELFYPVMDCGRLDAVRARYGLPAGAKYFLSVNTLEPRKNIEHALRCFATVLQESRIGDLYFLLVGTQGWDVTSIMTAINNANIASHRVILAGYVPDEDLAPLYSGALAFLYPTHYEGFGLPPLEAMQCGTPVITSNTSSLPEVVGDAGIMVSPSDEDALCQAMLDMYRQPALRADLATKSVVRSSYFSWERYTNDVVKAYLAALST
jgi:glycosyltransferase involved in cell wall biosynthesis